MESFGFWGNFIAEGYLWQSLVVLGLLVVCLLVQLLYQMLLYGRISAYRNPAPSPEAGQVGISVIIPLFEADFRFLNESLPMFLNQKHNLYEVVVVNVTGNEDFAEQIKLLQINNPQLTTTVLRADPLFPITTKMALNVGIKAAKYDNLVFTLPECTPRSQRWGEMFARGFVEHSVVLGYAALEPFGGLWNRMVRLANMTISSRWIADAVVGHPWRGTLGNIGFTKNLYYAARGFNHLNLNMGEEDLFVMKIANKQNTTLTLGGASTMSQKVWGGYGWWREQRISRAPLCRHYPLRARLLTGAELVTRVLFFGAAICGALFLPLVAKVTIAVVVLLRWLVLMLVAARTARRLSERLPLWLLPLYDLVAPVTELLLYIKRIFTPQHTWRSKNT